MGHVDYLSQNAPVERILLTRSTVLNKPSKTIEEHQAEDMFCQSIKNKSHTEAEYTVKYNSVYLTRPMMVIAIVLFRYMHDLLFKNYIKLNPHIYELIKC